ncbi:MAG: hypothetical protein ABJC39_02755 [Chloroflexota bacterium]
MARRVFAAICAAALVASLSASVVLGGEITGNGKSLHITDGKWPTGLHARSLCAFSGQEDLQFVPGGSKGFPGHAQSWGQISKADREFLTTIGFNPGKACNPNIGIPGE